MPPPFPREPPHDLLRGVDELLHDTSMRLLPLAYLLPFKSVGPTAVERSVLKSAPAQDRYLTDALASERKPKVCTSLKLNA